MVSEWIVGFLLVALLAGAITLRQKTRQHYQRFAKRLSLEEFRPTAGLRHHVLILATDIHRGIIPALQYARSISNDARGVCIVKQTGGESELRERWTLWSRGVPLVVLHQTSNSLIEPLLTYIDKLHHQEPNSVITVIIPEFVADSAFVKLLHGSTGSYFKKHLIHKRGVIVTSIPYHLDEDIEETIHPAKNSLPAV